MATTYYANMGGTRILSIDAATDHSGSDDNNVSNFSGDEFIVAINIWSGNKETPSSTYKLKWQDDTDASGYADLGATGELNYTITDSSWSHGDAVATGDQVCDSQGGDTRIAGERVKGQSLSDAIDLADDEQSELWFGVNCEGADGSHAYSFQLYSTAEGAVVGTCGATITMAAGLTHYDLVCSGGTFAYSGSVADLLKGYHLDCAGATFAYAGSDATFKRGYHLDAGVGSFPYSGAVAGLLRDGKIVASGGTFAYAGSDVTMNKGRLMSAAAGAFPYAGSDVSFSRTYKLSAAAGAFSYAGSVANLEKGYHIDAEAATFGYSGSVANLEYGRVIQALAATYGLSGSDATLLYNRLIGANGATFPYTGSDATLTKSGDRTLTAEAGAFPYVGSDVTLTYTPIAAEVSEVEGHGRLRRKRKLLTINDEDEVMEILDFIVKTGILE